MHELSLAESMMEIIQEQASREQFCRVTKVVLEIGALSHVEADAMRFCFEAVVAGTLADNATLEIAFVPAKGNCPECGKVSEQKNLYDPCQHCGAFGLTLVAGDQIRIRHLEVL